MNTYENEMMAMLRQGMSFDEVMNKMHTQLSNAQAQIRAEEEAKRLEEERKAKIAEAEAKAKKLQAEKEARGTVIVDIANRALNGTLTADDVAAIQMMYIKQIVEDENDLAVLESMLTGDEIDNTIHMALTTTHAFNPLLNAMGATWKQVVDSVEESDKVQMHHDARKQTKQKTDAITDIFESIFGATHPKAETLKKPMNKPNPVSDDQILRSFVERL